MLRVRLSNLFVSPLTWSFNAVLPNTFPGESFASSASGCGDIGTNHMDDDNSMDGAPPPSSSQSALSVSVGGIVSSAPSSSALAHQQQQQQLHGHLHQHRHQAVISPTNVVVAPLHQSAPLQTLLGCGNSVSEQTALQAATNQLIVQHTLEILAQVEHLAKSDNLTGANYALKSDPDEDDSDGSGNAQPLRQGHDFADATSRADVASRATPAAGVVVEELLLLSDAEIAFQLQPPAAPLPAYLNAYYVCECGSRLLFLSVHWVKQVPAFRRLAEEAQQALLLRSWTALFVLGLAQCSGALALPTIWHAMVAAIRVDVQSEERNSAGGVALRNRALAEAVSELQACVQALVTLGLDEVEFAYVKLVALFGMGKL